MRVTREEKVYAFAKDTAKSGTWLVTYTQPIQDAILADLYHYVWENLTRHALAWAERNFYSFFKDDENTIPWSNRQDIRCYHLHEKNRVEVTRIKISSDTQSK